MKSTRKTSLLLFTLLLSVLFTMCALSACTEEKDIETNNSETINEETSDEAKETESISETTVETETNTQEETTSEEVESTGVIGGKTHIAVLSDVHIGKQNLKPMPEDKFASAIDTINELFGRTDAIVFSGDLTDRGYDTEYQLFQSIFWEHAQSNTFLCTAMGNHEYFRDGVVRFGGESKKFLLECQEAYSSILGDLDTDTVVNGVHIIGVSVRSSAAQYEGCEDFLTTHIQAAAQEDPTMPIIVFTHEGLGSTFQAGNGSFASTVKTLSAKYPQIIWFSGHTHFALNDPRMISQQNYTNIQVPSVGADFWSYGFIDPDQPPDAATSSQGLLISVSDDKIVTIYRYDFTHSDFIGDPWVIDIPAICESKAAFTYTDKRAEKAESPTFENGEAKITEVDKYTAHLSFTAATVNDKVSDGMIMYYHVLVTDKTTGVPHFGLDINSDYYMGKAKKTIWDVDLTGLRHNTEYTVTVIAESVWGKTSAALSVDFKTEFDPDATEQESEIPCLVEADYTTGSYEDKASGLKTKVYGSPIFENNVYVMDKNTAVAYYLTDNEYSKLKNSVTIEAMIYIDPDQTYPWGYVNLISNTEAGGFGTSMYQNGDFHFDVNIGGSYKTAVANIQTGKWVHVVCSYDNAFLRIYFDGEIKASVPATGDIKHVAAISRQFMVGADVNGEGSTQCISNIRVAFVRLWAGGLTPENVTELHQKAVYPVN